MATAREQQNIDVVLRYFDGCNTGALDDLLPTLADDVVQHPAQSFQTIRGSAHLAWFWRKYKRTLDPTWRIDQIIAAGGLVVSEWYVMDDGVISEVRAYFAADGDSELGDFPYSERGYLPYS